MAKRLKKGDEVIVITGADKGRKGKILKILSNNKALVEGINIKKKHIKPNPNAGVEGGIIEKEAPIDVSNVTLGINLKGASNVKVSRKVGFKIIAKEGEKRKKVRFLKANEEIIDVDKV